jgi:KaiC/GvpD/RAD55 family RecA-like ATPase
MIADLEKIQGLALAVKSRRESKNLEIPTGFFSGIYKRTNDLLDHGKTAFEAMEILEKEAWDGLDDLKLRLFSDYIADFAADVQRNIDLAWADQLEKQVVEEIREWIIQKGGNEEKIKALYREAARYRAREKEKVGGCSIAEMAPEFIKFVKQKQSRELWGHKIKSLPALSNALMGIREITVLAAKPKVGKSTLADQIAEDIYSTGTPVIFVDLENGWNNLMARQFCRKNNVTLTDLFSKNFNEEILSAGGRYSYSQRKDFHILNDKRLTIEKIREFICQVKQSSGRDEVFLIIDSLQKLPMENLRERRAAVDMWLRGLEELNAEDPGLSILLISELSRDGNKPKESGDIEYTAHFFLELETGRSEKDLQTYGDDGTRELWIRAARDVEIPAGPLHYKADFQLWKFKEIGGF